MSVMQLALEALDSDNPDIQLRAAIALREKLAQPEHDYRTRYDRGCYKCGSHYCPADCPDPTHLVPQQPLCTSPPKTEQEPVAFINVEKQKLEWAKLTSWHTPTIVNLPKIPLYTAPPKREWVGLTEKEWHEATGIPRSANLPMPMLKGIEKALKKKNHG